MFKNNVKGATSSGDIVNLDKLRDDTESSYNAKNQKEMGRISIGDFGETVDDKDFLTKLYLNMKVLKRGQSLWDFDN